MPGTNNPTRPTEYRFTDVFLPVGRDHVPDTPGGCVTDRRGHACAVVGYDLDQERDAPLTFLVRFADGFECHVLPEEVDDHAPYRGDDPTVPPASEHGGVPGGERFRQVRHLRDRIIEARTAHHDALLFGDRFSGDPNFDHHDGAEAALRSYAAAFNLEVPGQDETQREALRRLERAHPDSRAVSAFVSTVRANEGLEESP